MHTPLPWELCDSGSSIVVAGGPNNDDIADFSYRDEHTVSITREEALANARLFMAAPMMHALLEKCATLIIDKFKNDLAIFAPLAQEMHAIQVIMGKVP